MVITTAAPTIPTTMTFKNIKKTGKTLLQNLHRSFLNFSIQRHRDRKRSSEAQLEAKNTPAPVILTIYYVPFACLSPCPRLSILCLHVTTTLEIDIIITPIWQMKKLVVSEMKSLV